ncbi:terminase large subunit [Erysipelotrichaceae bacterium OttesenSCG-928-M19]|nr:terminase large subunit [Erysipelotrichaceae bacterium OttesenSCG-928-M19]
MKNIELYHKRVAEGKTIVSQSMLQQIDRVKNYLNVYEFDQQEVDRCITFIEKYVKHFKGSYAAKPFKLSLWQKYIVSVIIGFYHYVSIDVVDVNGDVVGQKRERRRLTRECFIEMARKNGKSMFASALALYMLILDREKSPEIYVAANSLSQVNKTIYQTVLGIINNSKELKSRVKKRRTDIELLKGGSLTPVATDSSNLDGLSPHFVIFDEVHEFTKDDLIDVMLTALGSRRNPMLMYITSNGTTRNKTFDRLIKQYKSILNGVVENDSVQVFIFEQDNEKEIEDEMKWQKSNPNIDISCDRSYLRDMYQLIFDSPEKKNGILSKNFCLPQEASTIFFTPQESETEDIELNKLMYDTYGTFGLDLSMHIDLSVLTYLFEVESIRYVKQWYFMPKDKLKEKEKIDQVPYSVWAEKGYLVLMDGEYIKPVEIFDFMLEKIREHKLFPQAIGYDRYYAGEFAIKSLEHFGDFMAKPVIQGPKTFSPALNKVKAMLRTKELVHSNPMLQWCLLNTTVRKDINGNICTDKKNANGRIDGTDSLIDAFVVFEENYSRGNLENKHKGGE